MSASVFDIRLLPRRWRSLAILAGVALTVLAMQLCGIGYGFQFLVVAVFFPLMILGYVRSTMERLGDIKPDWLETSDAFVGERRENPSPPFEDPIDFARLPLEERITLVAELCCQFGRRVSVIHCQFYGSDRATFERAVSVLRGGVRRTDYFESVGEKEISICLNMIRDLGEVELVTRRLSTALEKAQIDRAEWSVGSAMYPVHGYAGADLIDFARQNGRRPSKNGTVWRRARKSGSRNATSQTPARLAAKHQKR